MIASSQGFMIAKIKILVVLFVLAVFSNVSTGQIVKLPSYILESGASLSSGRQSPFWFVCNQFGKQSVNNASGFLSAQITAHEDTSKKIDYTYGLELFDRVDGENKFWLHQAYFRVRMQFLYLRVGKCEESYGNQDSILSSGSALWSKNPRPMPKIVIGTNDFVNVPFTKGYLKFNGLLAHGWFGEGGYAKDVYLHHKYINLKLGGNLPVNLTWGLHHYAMWGGVDPVLGPAPNNLDAYWRVFLNRPGNPEDPNTSEYDTLNRLGNHLGSRNYAVDIRLRPFKIRVYYQTIFEDNSGFKKHFMRDGLWGIVMRTRESDKIINSVLYERFYTMYQSGRLKPDHNLKSTEVDNYFNHYFYQSGWTYHGFTIGSPLITSPELSTEKTRGISNNRLIAHHIGISGKINIVNYRILATWSRNYGTYPMPFSESRHSGSLLFQFSNDYSRTKGLEAVLQFGVDRGEMYGNNMGIGVIVRKHGAFKR